MNLSIWNSSTRKRLFFNICLIFMKCGISNAPFIMPHYPSSKGLGAIECQYQKCFVVNLTKWVTLISEHFFRIILAWSKWAKSCFLPKWVSNVLIFYHFLIFRAVLLYGVKCTGTRDSNKKSLGTVEINWR